MRIYFDKILILFHVSHGFSVPSSYSRQVSVLWTGFLFRQHGFSHDSPFTQNERPFLLPIAIWKTLPARVPQLLFALRSLSTLPAVYVSQAPLPTGFVLGSATGKCSWRRCEVRSFLQLMLCFWRPLPQWVHHHRQPRPLIFAELPLA